MKARFDITDHIKSEYKYENRLYTKQEQLKILKKDYDNFYVKDNFILDSEKNTVFIDVDIDVVLSIGDKVLLMGYDFDVRDKKYIPEENRFIYFLDY